MKNFIKFAGRANVAGVVSCVMMADIWMKVRRGLRNRATDAAAAIADDLDSDSATEETDTHGE